MLKWVSKSMKYLVVGVLALALSITTLIVGAPNAKAADAYGDGTEIYTLTFSKFKKNSSTSAAGSSGQFSWPSVAEKGSDYVCVNSEFKVEIAIADEYKGRISKVDFSIDFDSSNDYDYFNEVKFTYGDNEITNGLGKDINHWGFGNIDEAQYGTMTFQFPKTGSQTPKLEGFSIEVYYGDKYTVTITPGLGIDKAFMYWVEATSSGWNNEKTVVAPIDVYAFVKIKDGFKADINWTKVYGNQDEAGSVYRVGSVRIVDSGHDFGTFNAIPKDVTIKRDGNGASDGSDVTITYNKAATISALSRTNYEFVNWNTIADGTGTSYETSLTAEQVNALIDSKATVLYAQWKLSKEIQDVIDLIDLIDTVTYPDSKDAIETAEDAFDALNDTTKQGLVSNSSVLTQARSTYDGLRTSAIENVNALIEELVGSEIIYPTSKSALENAEKAYADLDDDDKNTDLIPDYQKLLDARSDYNSQGATMAAETDAAINAINPNITYPGSEAELTKANTLYNSLDAYGRDLVENYATLYGYNSQYGELREAAIENVEGLINAIVTTKPLVYPGIETKINAARSAFNQLGKNDQDEWSISNLQILLDAELVTNLVHAINNTGKVEDTTTFRGKVSGARTAYDALTDYQSELFPPSVYSHLEELEKIIAVMDEINAIGNVKYTSASKSYIDAAQEAYDNLVDNLKDQVANYDKLEQANIDYDSVDAVVNEINNIPTFAFTDPFKEILDHARASFNGLTNYQQSIFPQDVLNKLIEDEKQYAAFETITNIGEIENTEESRNRVKKAKEAYDALTLEQQEVLGDKKYIILNAVAAFEVIDMVNNVKKAGYTTKDKEDIDKTREAYEALTNSQKAIFPQDTVAMLVNIEKAYPVMVTINQIGGLEYKDTFKDKIDAAKKIFDNLN